MRLGQALFPLFALALDLPEDFFADKVRLVLLCVVTVVIGGSARTHPGPSLALGTCAHHERRNMRLNDLFLV